MTMKIWCISDIHNKQAQLKVPIDVDMVIVAGDATNSREPSVNVVEMEVFLNWFKKLPIKYKVFVPGNHDTSVQAGMLIRQLESKDGFYCLIHESVTIEGITIFGSPWTPTFNNWAYNASPELLTSLWKDIPYKADIVVTHGPAYGILDSINWFEDILNIGDKSLLKEILLKQPKYHIFGHAHLQGNTVNNSNENTISINVAVVDEGYRKVNDGIVFSYNKN